MSSTTNMAISELYLKENKDSFKRINPEGIEELGNDHSDEE